MDKIKVIINDEEYFFEKGISLFEISEQFKKSYSFPILVCYVDNEIYELNNKIDHDCKISFITVKDPVGNSIYQKSLIFLLSYVFKLLYKKENGIKACHSLDKAIRMKSSFAIDESELKRIKEKMHEVVSSAIPIEKILVKRTEAVEHFISINDLQKAETFKYTTNHYVNLYRIGDMYNYLFSYLPVNTNVFTDFDLTFVDSNNFLLQFPVISVDDKIPNFENREKVLDAFNINYKRAKRLGIFNSSDINRIVADGKINDVIKLTEVISSNDLLEIAKTINGMGNKIKVILMAGPSSSAKTTTARKLSMFLKSFGFNPKPLSIDDYFISREKTPKLPNGDYDFECLEAVDVELFNNHLDKLLNGEKVEIPTFNFKKGIGEYLGNTLKLNDGDILIIEGLHAINEKLTFNVPLENKFKIYISPFTDLNIDNLNIVSNSDIRLLRRIVRDNRTRGYTAEHTILSWQNVRRGEEQHIFPFQNEVDVVYNSSLIYEIGVLKLYVEPLLYGINSDSPAYEEAIRLINFLGMFCAIPSDEIPRESILREFIGNSYFE